jgi:hypothetical protein
MRRKLLLASVGIEARSRTLPVVNLALQPQHASAWSASSFGKRYVGSDGADLYPLGGYGTRSRLCIPELHKAKWLPLLGVSVKDDFSFFFLDGTKWQECVKKLRIRDGLGGFRHVPLPLDIYTLGRGRKGGGRSSRSNRRLT